MFYASIHCLPIYKKHRKKEIVLKRSIIGVSLLVCMFVNVFFAHETVYSTERSSSHKPVGHPPKRSDKQSRQTYKAQQITLHSFIPVSFQQIMYRMSSFAGWTRNTGYILKQAYINTATATRIANPYPPTQSSHND